MSLTSSITTHDVWTRLATARTVAGAMELHITRIDTVALALQIADETGEPIEQAVHLALRERFDRVRGAPATPELRAAAIKRIQERVARLPVLDDRDPHEMLDDDGLWG